MGRKRHKWLPEFSDLIVGMARKGNTYQEMARGLNVSESILKIWRKEIDGLQDAINCSRLSAVSNVEGSLYRQAMGYHYDEDRVVGGKVVSIRRYQHPVPLSTIFFLKNMEPHSWNKEHFSGISGSGGVFSGAQIIINTAHEFNQQILGSPGVKVNKLNNVGELEASSSSVGTSSDSDGDVIV